MYIACERLNSCEETKASKTRRPSNQSSTYNCTTDPPPDKKEWEVGTPQGEGYCHKTGGSEKGRKRKMEVEISKPCMQWEAAYEGTGSFDDISKGLVAN